MGQKLLIFLIAILGANSLFAQDQYTQYFDGADTAGNFINIEIENTPSNIWQIGSPQKVVFDNAATAPNVLVTDTLNFYPPDNSSSFQFYVHDNSSWGITAVRWKQKLDMKKGQDGGKIEFSSDNGITWHNAFSSPFVYNFYGFELSNRDTIAGEVVFSGTDSTWRDIWLCFENSWSQDDSVLIRFEFTSGPVSEDKEGWMIDNMMYHITWVHTVDEIKKDKYLHVYPNPSNDIIFIEAQKLREFHIIEHMLLVNPLGQVMDEWKNVPTKFFIDSKKYPPGNYYLKIKTNKKSEAIPVVISR